LEEEEKYINYYKVIIASTSPLIMILFVAVPDKGFMKNAENFRTNFSIIKSYSLTIVF